MLQRENESKACYERFLKHMQTHHYPSTLTLQMYMLFASHMNIGTPEILHFYQQMEAEAAAAPEFHGTNILWVHLLPYYQETLREYFNLSDNYQIQAIEMNLDYRTPLNTEHPLDALAEKMVQNIYNGPYERKAKLVSELAQDLHSDGCPQFLSLGLQAVLRRSHAVERRTGPAKYSAPGSGRRWHGSPQQPRRSDPHPL